MCIPKRMRNHFVMRRTYSFCALLELLGEVPRRIEDKGRDMVIKFTDLVVKCLIKITKTLSLTIQAGPLVHPLCHQICQQSPAHFELP